VTAAQRAKGSLNPDYAKECGGKLRHPHLLSALQHAKQLEQSFGKKAACYRCSYCGHEHVATVPSYWDGCGWRKRPGD
jgi:hypothetical protein